MEVMAVTKAMSWLETQNATHACFLSDSMSMLRKIQTGWIREQWLQSVIRSGLQRVTFIFVPGHAGVSGNERADRLASCAPIASGRAMDRADILNAIREKGRTEDSQNDEDSTSVSRLLELGVKCGAARLERHTGHMRQLINQHRTGTVSRHVLANILKGMSERLWTCSTC